MIHIVLFQPENAGNLGNIIRTAYIFNAQLHLIRPYGWLGNLHYFKNQRDKNYFNKCQRASMDCFDKITIQEYDSWNEFYETINCKIDKEIFYFSKHAATSWQIKISNIEKNIKKKNYYLVFGSESHGLKRLSIEFIINEFVILEPMNSKKSYNLSNAVAIALYSLFIKLKNN